MELYVMTTRELRRLEVLQRLRAGEITQRQAAVRLGLCIRQIKRLWRAYQSEGPAGLRSRRRGRPSNRRVNPELLAQALDVVGRCYPDFGPTLAVEKLLERDGIAVKRETLRKAMITAGIWKPHGRRSVALHPPRERRPQFGELVQADGSPHAWFERRGPRCVLLVAIDDATSRIVGGRFAPRETTDAYFNLTERYLRRYGKPRAFYVDKHSIFKTSVPRIERPDLTQFARAMEELDIELICANSPQAKGRVERANQTLQDRLVKELRLQDINSIDEANDFLDGFLEKHNQQFAVLPACDVDAHRGLAEEDDLANILCRTTARRISRQLTVQYQGQLYRIVEPGNERRPQYVAINVRERADGLRFELDNGMQVAFELMVKSAPRPIVDAKSLNEHLDRTRLGPRTSNPAYQRKPALEHPWRRLPSATPASRPFRGDTSK